MNKDEFQQFAFNLVDETIEHVFLRFPEDPIQRASVYRFVARQFEELAADLDLV